MAFGVLATLSWMACGPPDSATAPEPAVPDQTVSEPPTIVVEPSDTTVFADSAASFHVEAAGTSPLHYQWRRNGKDVPGAVTPTFALSESTRADSLSSFLVQVTNEAGSVTSRDARVRVLGGKVYGLSGFLPRLDLMDDLVGVRYRLRVAENRSETLRLVFGFFWLYSPGTRAGYFFEVNVYSGLNTYPDRNCVTWPPGGAYAEGRASLDVGITDYPFERGDQSQITTGVRTSNSGAFPVRTILVDGIPNLWKSTARSQWDMNGSEVSVTVLRGDTTSDVSAFERCGLRLAAGVYRRWTQRLEWAGGSAEVEVVVPDRQGRYLREVHMLSEYLHGAGAFSVQYRDFEVLRESGATWQRLSEFTSTYRYDGNGVDFGTHVLSQGEDRRIEITNGGGGPYFLRRQPFSLTPPGG